MALRSQQRKKPKTCPLELAVAAVENDGGVLDLPVEGFDGEPLALNLHLVGCHHLFGDGA
jgi:hypothetical protein